MTKIFLTLHVLAAILTVGPVAVAASMFPAALHRAQADPGDPGAVATLRTLHRICRVYAALGISVPILGFATASSLGVLGTAWLITSIILTTGAVAILAMLVLPAQRAALDGLQAAQATRATASASGAVALEVRAGARLAMFAGIFNLLWAAVTILMIVRPGSTTGA